MSDCCPLGYLFIYPTGRIRVCKIRFVNTGENLGKPCPVCKKMFILTPVFIVRRQTSNLYDSAISPELNPNFCFVVCIFIGSKF